MKLEENIRKMIDKIRNMNEKEKVLNIGLICIIGVVMVLVSNFFRSADNPKGTSANMAEQQEVVQTTSSQPLSDYQSSIQKDLKSILGKIEGVGNIDVMITFESLDKKEIAYNTQESNNTTTENDNQGGERVIEESQKNLNAIMVNKNGSNEPLIITENYPSIKGVIVVADGASNPDIKYNLLKCVENVLDLPSHKVMIYSRKK
ncbi:stage III sporulation protein AG [Alkalibaculum bacchi]|uniref:Stage III sporulation protein AG n=1 Tax=Alkalibaculum bacchi TaxID=645887 RepID=A0A366IAR9_9FIRM|nr:stage III sporulation protein AG [Alkalibaculum bacchi]RBP65273.1 stage III sporulation protein AG [Alkalibaculum bacchi]